MFYFLRKFFCLHKFYYYSYKKHTARNTLHIVAGGCVKCFKSKMVSEFNDTYIENETQARNLVIQLNNLEHHYNLYKYTECD